MWIIMWIILKTLTNGFKKVKATFTTFFTDQKTDLNIFSIVLNIDQKKKKTMHNDPIIRLWMLQNALTTFTQIVHCADRLFFYKNNCQGVIFLAHFF